jgi:hypothetical protein
MESPTALLMCGRARSTGYMILLLGANGAFGLAGHASIDVKAGYGNSHTYGTVSLSRSFSWDE